MGKLSPMRLRNRAAHGALTRRDHTIAITSIIVVVVLASVTTIGIWSARQVRSAARSVDAHATVLSAYRDVQAAVAEQAFAEAGYRRSPSAASRTRLEDSLDGLSAAVGSVGEVGSDSDRATAVQLLALNERYASDVRAALRQGTVAPPTRPNDRVAGPALDAIDRLVHATIDTRQQGLDEAVASQRAVVARVLTLLPNAVLGGSFVLIGCWWLIARRHRRLEVVATQSASEADHDALTGLANRRQFDRRLDAALAASAPTGLLLLDLDGFKQLNDGFGHQAGDAALVAVARRLTDCVRHDDLVARLGGDEFGVITDGADDLTDLADRLGAAVRAPVRLDAGSHQLGVSIGIASAGPADDAATLIARADAAMYAAKSSTRTDVA